MPVSIYLASTYEAHPRMLELARALAPFEVTVTSRWIHGGHELGDRPTDEARKQLAVEDLEDIDLAEVVVIVNPTAIHRSGRGGRHVEVGYALRSRKPLILIGERENVFHWLISTVLPEGTAPVEIARAIWRASAPERDTK